MIKTKKICVTIAFILLIAFAAIVVVSMVGKNDVQEKGEDSVNGLVLDNDEKLVEKKVRLASMHANKKTVVSKEEELELKNKINAILSDKNLTEEQSNYELEKLGVYELDTSSNDIVTPVKSSRTDISLNALRVFYNSSLRQWILSGCGNWATEAFFTDVGKLPRKTGAVVDVGSDDGIGILLQDTYGNGNGVLLQSGSCGSFIHGAKKVTTCNSDAGLSSNYGAMFLMQDVIHCTYGGGLFSKPSYQYNAYGFTTTLHYNSAFENYHGKAVLVYAHTYSTAYISGFGISTTGISVQFVGKDGMFAVKGLDTGF